MVKVQPGTYEAKVVAAAIQEYPSGAVMCRMQVDIDGQILTGGICLIQRDGTLSERAFRDVKAIFGMATWDWAAWEQEPETFAGADVQVVVDVVQGDKGEFNSIKYINPPGGGQRLERGDVKSLATKYGAKTRALLGGAPMTPSARSKPAARPKPPAPLVKATMEDCWEQFVKVNPDKEERELYPLWDVAIRAHTGKAQSDCGPEDWGTLMTALSGQLPL